MPAPPASDETVVVVNRAIFGDVRRLVLLKVTWSTYGMDCKALKAENRAENQPNMPPTNMKDTVIPKSGGTQTPETTPTTGVSK
jgi:hypothetical protein